MIDLLFTARPSASFYLISRIVDWPLPSPSTAVSRNCGNRRPRSRCRPSPPWSCWGETRSGGSPSTTIVFRYFARSLALAGSAGRLARRSASFSSVAAASTSAMNYSSLPCSSRDRRAGCRSRLAMFSRRDRTSPFALSVPPPRGHESIGIVHMQRTAFRLRTILQGPLHGVAVER